ncbi:16S rRNA (guanine(966)-N(2))-methyltransferase RsmD [Marinobacterium jannaschii]|uniref:16S rRNA (guanine(966)-N(2))-methyltransferase RsmD n=1 Tax=Marinobacterium jannaschii TaxID=64970 RepID=UPI000A426524|nr:16S rRNA (guanine(966)-N(2))-methyltransferase RsmD [Marinobacterium jannaschii]
MLRIIGGEWRSRKVPFAAIVGLRPTPDRVRETLFNWLQFDIAGARCLDLFSGSGALGLEALSRGAASVTFIDQAPEVVRQLKENLSTLKCSDAQVIQASVINWLEQQPDDLTDQFDIVFMDPPFRKGLVNPCCALLEQKQLLSENALIYVENEREAGAAQAASHWLPHRQKQAGQVNYQLYRRQPDADA